MFERLRSTPRGEDDHTIVPLDLGELSRAGRRDWLSSYADLADAVSACPELAWRVSNTSDYIVGGRWRRRQEIGTVEELHARSQRRRLLGHLKGQLLDRGASLLLLSTTEQERALGAYLGEGFGLVDEIVRYQREGINAPPAPPEFPIRPLLATDAGQLLALDHASFPWLWWNSEEEFDWYLRLPGVQAVVVDDGARLVGYASYTITGRQGHLDRLAVLPEYQGKGYGRALVLATLSSMAQRRIERVALTTQVDNYRSAGLYAGLGFTRTRIRYPIYGVWLDGEHS